MTRIALSLALALCASLAAAQPAPAVKKPQAETPKKILFVGNSYFYYNDSIHNHVRRMVDADGLAPNKDASPDMIRKVEAMYVAAGNEVGALVIPVGLAFEEAYRQRPGVQLH